MADALLTTGLATVASVITAVVTTRLQSASEFRKWQRDMTLMFAKAASADEGTAARIAVQFAVGFVKILDAVERERFFIPAGTRITVGRAPENEIRIDDSQVSRRHCAFVSDRDTVYLEDFASTSGVEVNGHQVVQGRVSLKDGDVIKIGNTTLQFWLLSR